MTACGMSSSGWSEDCCSCSLWLIHTFRMVTRFCFVKQKTAYDMRISDWSSDVCSSDLFDAGCNSAAPVVGRQETQIGLVMAALDFERGHFDLLDQLALIGVHGVKPVDHVMLVHVGSGITQGAERVHHAERLLAAALQAAVNALRFIEDRKSTRLNSS